MNKQQALKKRKRKDFNLILNLYKSLFMLNLLWSIFFKMDIWYFITLVFGVGLFIGIWLRDKDEELR
jgi:hypothetical protein